MLAKKAQSVYLDLFIAVFIMTAVLVFFFQSEANLVEESTSRLNDLIVESKSISDTLMTSGIPSNWTSDSVDIIGITDSYIINSSKLDMLQDMVDADYGDVRQKLGTAYDFFLFFEDKDGVIDINGDEGIGKAGVNSTNVHQVEKPADLVTEVRLVVYDNKPAKMILYLWN